ncbi:TPA: CTP synthase [Candidatus Uhrbacteria bacterium]|uniref:CTP synthase n=2 Tax=Candidatus Uhriibacteriota TaxID=1752732 RepID=A0A0G1T7C2_9BACT|nr:MAG: CTP synthetase [Candidatus Uhrbacteria bacterium GW2011_GWF2_46_218]KKU41310.1 MAG: CTP synthetase [Candidatus Uhrbacteria bacterium GW2011_GWE2_46_68]HBK33747.1 CTP synthase [Candidatus Uhrbacteria bacterium]HCB19412.1 CTP synthase [Candidatus Uhrbacteria bacterium]
MEHRYIFVVGGVMSGVGKGTVTASLGRVLEAKGFRTTAIKIDPYINVDAGTMNPVEHGEVFVTIDGDETDQDIGNYERFLEEDIYRDNYMTTGRVYLSVIERERALGYNGRCVEVVPDVPNEVIDRIERAATKSEADFVLVEVGGTIGEYQNILFLEAARMMRQKAPDRVRHILVSYMPVPPSIGEMKTKPTQYAIRSMMGAGLVPDFVVARSEMQIDEPRRRKLSLTCGVPEGCVIGSPNVPSIYEVPLLFEEQGFGDLVLKSFGIVSKKKNGLRDWKKMVTHIRESKEEVKIGVVGKYFSTGNFVLSDVYISVLEAIKHAAWARGKKPVIEWINSEQFEQDPKSIRLLSSLDGVVIPGGFGSRGVEGKIKTIQYCREHKIPYFGLCYGMQLAVVEYARHVLKWKDAHTTEIDEKTTHPVIHLLPEQERPMLEGKYGGTMRLGAYPCRLKKGTIAAQAYRAARVEERHRHRYEFNNVYRQAIADAGLVFSGINPDQNLVEIVELPEHPFFLAVQFHPEFQSRPLHPHPLFLRFFDAAFARKTGKNQEKSLDKKRSKPL